jgi:hypothetical protein
MNIQRVQPGSVNTKPAEQLQRTAREQEKAPVDLTDPTPVDAPPTVAPPAVATAPAQGVKKKMHPRLEAFGHQIESRLSQASQARDLSPRQKAALDQAQTQFHSMLQRLDDAYGNTDVKRRPIGDALNDILSHLTQVVNHIQNGGATEGPTAPLIGGELDVKG